MKAAAIAILLVTLASLSRAETRWCEVTGRGAGDTLFYPPIAGAARVSGVVVAHLLFTPDGKVSGIEPIFGPVMLMKSVDEQVKKWSVQTSAQGDQACMALLIVEYRLEFPDSPLAETPIPAAAPGTIRIRVDGEVYIISDPGGTLSWSLSGRLRNFARRTWSRIFDHEKPWKMRNARRG